MIAESIGQRELNRCRFGTDDALTRLMGIIRFAPKLGFVLLFALAFVSFHPVAHANPSCDQLFRENKPLTELETLRAVQAYVPRDRYELTKDEVIKIAREVGLSIEETYFELARVAATRSSSPISNFGVGAAGVTASGDVFLGANIEFKRTHLGSTLHAERTVLVLANDAGAKLERLYSTVTPCGGCRQWLNEIEGGSNLQVVSKDRDGVLFSKTLAELLPLDFGPGALGQKGLMDAGQPRNGSLARVPVMISGLNRAEIKALISAVESSYSPYTKAPAGALLQLKDGRFLTGSYIEGAAYESYSPDAVAIAKLKMMGLSSDQVSSVYILATSPLRGSMLIDHEAQARALLPALNDEKFDGASAPITFRSIVLRRRE
jgi:cytidine deaminase